MTNFRKLLSIAVVFFAVPLTVYAVIVGIKYFSKAGSQPATLVFSQNPIIVDATSTTATVVNLVLNAGTSQVGFAAVSFNFDNTKVKLSSEIVPPSQLKKIIVMTSASEANSTGKVKLVFGLDPADINNPPTGSFNLAQIAFKALGTTTSTSNVTFDTTAIQVVDMTDTAMNVTATNATINVTGATAVPSPTATPFSTSEPTSTPTSTPTPTPTGNVSTFNFKVKFQGIGTAVGSKQVKVTLKNGATVAYTSDVTVTADNNSGAGVYTGTLSGFNPGTYDVYIKEPTHLQRKFAGITLVAGSNSGDFSADLMKAGDFNGDNILELGDVGLILTQYNALSVPVNQNNSKYDVDGDGSIRIADVGIVLTNYNALQVRGD